MSRDDRFRLIMYQLNHRTTTDGGVRKELKNGKRLKRRRREGGCRHLGYMNETPLMTTFGKH